MAPDYLLLDLGTRLLEAYENGGPGEEIALAAAHSLMPDPEPKVAVPGVYL